MFYINIFFNYFIHFSMSRVVESLSILCFFWRLGLLSTSDSNTKDTHFKHKATSFFNAF